MAKRVELEKQSATLRKESNSMRLQFIVGLLMGIFYLLTIANAQAPSLEDGIPENGKVIENITKSNAQKCNIFSGEWIQDTSAPSYAKTSCKYVFERWNCMTNGRSDMRYLYWRWKPHNCNLLTVDPKAFLNAMRDKSLAMIGDSLLRNQMQSLLCLLSQVEKSVYTNEDNTYEFSRWYFPSYNFTIANFWAPFLLEAERLPDKKVIVYLDALEETWTAEYYNYDYIVIASGPWFSTPTILMQNNTVVGCHSCNGEYKELGSFYIYQRALQMAFNFVTKSHHKPVIVYRTWSPEHFEYGEWFSGGYCNRTVPYREGEYNDTPTGRKNYAIDIEEFSKASAVGYEKGIRMKLLDIYHLSMLRPDGHPGTRIKDGRVLNDCVHWCLPGPIDTWNYLMMNMLLDEVDSSWRDNF